MRISKENTPFCKKQDYYPVYFLYAPPFFLVISKKRKLTQEINRLNFLLIIILKSSLQILNTKKLLLYKYETVFI